MLFDAKKARRPLPPPRARNGALSDLRLTSRQRPHTALESPGQVPINQSDHLTPPFPLVTYDPSRDMSSPDEHGGNNADGNNATERAFSSANSISLSAGGLRALQQGTRGAATMRDRASQPVLTSRVDLEADSDAATAPQHSSHLWMDEYRHRTSRQPRSHTAIIDDVLSGPFGGQGSEYSTTLRRRRSQAENEDGGLEGRRVRQRLRDTLIETDREMRNYPWRDNRRDGVIFDDMAGEMAPGVAGHSVPSRWFVDSRWDVDSSFGRPSDSDHELFADNGPLAHAPWTDDADQWTIV